MSPVQYFTISISVSLGDLRSDLPVKRTRVQSCSLHTVDAFDCVAPYNYPVPTGQLHLVSLSDE